MEVFDGSYEGDIHTYLGCVIERDLLAAPLPPPRDTTPKRYCAHMMHLLVFLPLPSTFLPPGQRLVKCMDDAIPDRAFHVLYRGIVGSLRISR